MKKFTNLYQVSKTLRFELKPIGKTLENIERNGLLDEDQHRAESYKKVKKIIDRYHKAFIETAFDGFHLQFENVGAKNSLAEFYELYKTANKDEKQKKSFENIQENLRKQIVTQFKSQTNKEKFDHLFKKDLIEQDLPNFVKEEVEIALVNEFKGFTTYFGGFHKNRKNIYSDEAKSTAIAHRLIHDNLPRFIDNIAIFDKFVSSDAYTNLGKLQSDMSEYLNVNNISEMFQLDYFSDVLTQTQIDVYNTIIGGRAEEGKQKIQGLNEYINLYNQKQSDKKARLPKFIPLYKQILSDRVAISWLPEMFENGTQLLESIEQYWQNLHEILPSMLHLLQNLNDYDVSKIYLRNDLTISNISQQLFNNWRVINQAILAEYSAQNPQKKRETTEKFEARQKKFLKSFESIPIQYINTCLQKMGQENTIQDYFAKTTITDPHSSQKINLFDALESTYSVAKELLNTDYPIGKSLSQDEKNIAKIKDLLDAILALQHFVKPLLGKGDEGDKDERFYGELSAFWDIMNDFTPLYNKVRNYLTKKPYSNEKFKLNFGNSTLLNGWDLNKESDNTCSILRKNGLYYLVVMNKKFNQVLDEKHLTSDGDCYEKMVYKLLPGAKKMLPKVFFAQSNREDFSPSAEIEEIRANESFKKGDAFNLDDCQTLIDFYKASIHKHEDWRVFDFHFSDTKNYEDISKFYREVEHQGYKITFRKVSEKYIHRLVEEGKIYLFQIYNKDFSPYSSGTPNMHTLYWKMLFDEQNLDDVVYKLNGEAEVFYRKKSLNYSDEVMEKGHHYAKLKDKFDYPIIKDRRYTVDKFQFHVPITMNFKAENLNNINVLVNEHLKKCENNHIIGIDRGERHLLYLSVIDMMGNIKEQFSLNEIVNEHHGKYYSTNYREKLDAKEKERQAARESWKTIAGIKDLKEGYLSQVIHKIAELMVKYNAIVVLEDLNFGFMRGRQKFEKSVYQQFERKLIDKLNFLVDKKKSPDSAGGLLHAYQLTNKFEGFKKMGKQSGFLFYIPAWMTSKMDPITGFVNLFDTHYESEQKTKTFFEKFDKIEYNSAKDWFEFSFDYANFTEKATATRTKWTICTYGQRIETFRNPEKNSEWDNREIDLTQAFKDFFNGDYRGDMKAKILTQTGKTFWEGLLRLFKLTLQMRNSRTGTEEDWLISPVVNEADNCFDSRVYERMENPPLPRDADANGAYNIARKGLWVIRQIQQTDDLSKLKLAISNKEWLRFAQEKPYLNDSWKN